MFKQVEPNQGLGDDTSLNSIKLDCKGLDGVRSGGRITSREGLSGSWFSDINCPSTHGPTFLKEFRLQVESDQHVCKQIYANNAS